METRRTTYLNFMKQPNPGKVTQLFYVYSPTEPSGRPLGVVRFRPTWRKYVYESGNVDYDTTCLSEILKFLKDLTEERKENASS